jgi:hypothetical protein
MDFLDPRKQRMHMIRLIVGYVLIGLGIVLATSILLRIAYGFGLDRNGEVVQNGFVFVASQPQGANIYVDNKLYKDTTGARLQLPEGNYSIKVQRDGYRSWQRQVGVLGNSVSRYDYPLLVPNNLATTPVKNYASMPGFATQSPDRRWVLVHQPGSVLDFDVYDIGDAKKIAANTTSISLPAGLLNAAGSGDPAWKLTEWSTDNRHVILEHFYTGGSEYILVDRVEPARSVNLTKALQLGPGEVLSLRDKKFDKYYVYNPTTRTVGTTTVADAPTVSPVLADVLAYKSYGSDILLYATGTGATNGKVMTMLRDGNVTYKIRDLPAGAPYLLDLAQYSGSWFVAVGGGADKQAYVYKNPQTVRKAAKQPNLIPIQVLRLNAPNYLAFSSNTRFIMIENATSFAVYDAETDKSYAYTVPQPLDAGQTHANWMDGHRMTYVSGGKQIIFDYDNANLQTLAASAPAHLPFFDRDYRYVYNLASPPANPALGSLTTTGMLIAKDQ